MLALADKGGKEARALADHHLLAAACLGLQHISGAGEIVDKGLGTDNVFAGAKGPDHMLGMQMVRRVDADGVDRRVGQHGVVVGCVVRQAKLGTAFLRQCGIGIAQAHDVPQFAADAGRDNAAAFAKAKDTQSKRFHGSSRFLYCSQLVKLAGVAVL